MKLYETIKKQTYDVDIPAHKTGEWNGKCPVCKDSRKPGNQNDKPFMFNVTKGTGKCFNCEATFVLYKEFERPEKIEKNYTKPIWRNKTDINPHVVKYFENRKISQNTLIKMKVTSGFDWMPKPEKQVTTIHFNYFRENELINIKYRSGRTKEDRSFRLESGAELIFYNLDAIKESDECLICEGEPDCLSWIESNYKFAVSVPNGAQKGSNNFQYIDNCYEYFENKTKIYISYDNDEPGIALKNELVRRLGSERCFLIDLEGEKDANDYLIKYGGERLNLTLKNAKEIPIEGVFTTEDFESDLDYLYSNGLQPGLKIGHPNFDELLTIESGRLMIGTGIPGHGKSEFIDEIVERLNIFHGWKAAYFSPENWPLQYHTSKIIEKITGQKFSKENINIYDYQQVKIYMNDNFNFIMPSDYAFGLDSILEKAKALVRRKGIKIVVLDPWNRLESDQEKGETETKFIGRQLIKMANFAKINDVLFILIAHPVKIAKNASGQFEVPNLYNISGSANFFNICDYGLTVYREDDQVCVHVQKVKFKHLGQKGVACFKYVTTNGRYTPNVEGQEVKFDYTNHLKNKLNKTEQMTFADPKKDYGLDSNTDFDTMRSLEKETEQAPF
jgi:twinkle protein